MSRFLSSRFASQKPYTPGEQPKDRRYIKLNTNESPYPPSPKAVENAAKAAEELQLYSDPECKKLTAALSALYGIGEDEVIWTNGSDDVLYFAFSAFCDEKTPAIFPDITYGFYPVFARYCGVPYQTVPLRDDFSVDPARYYDSGKTVFIANPNAPTGLVLTVPEIEEILCRNPNNVVVIDEAYVDFGGESAVPLIRRYENLLVTQTFSKSRSMAGARLGFGVASPALISDLKQVKYSINPYAINSMTMAAGIGALSDEAYTRANCEKIRATRAYCAEKLRKMGFCLTDSRANFLFVRHPRVSGEALYCKLRERGILVRHFSQPRIEDYCRVTVGSREEMDAFLIGVAKILEE